jgi:hypothetical protein
LDSDTVTLYSQANAATRHKLNARALEIRNASLLAASEKYGRAEVMSWADDPLKVKLVNAMACIQAEDEA